MAGNISPAALDKLSEAIDNTALPDIWVLELSSFQLETAHTFAPDAAVVFDVRAPTGELTGAIEDVQAMIEGATV